MIERDATVRQLMRFFDEYLDEPSITEICVNEPREIWTLSGQWQLHESTVDNDDLDSLSTAVAAYCKDEISDTRTMMTGELPDGERIHVVRPPTAQDFSVTIRKPSSKIITQEQYIEQGFYKKTDAALDDNGLMDLFKNNKMDEFMPAAVMAGKTVLIASSTGAGKTTYLRSLCQYIPPECRVITLEDVPEIQTTHANKVALFYQSTKANNASSEVTATQALRSILRMLPSRILVGELRGAETMDFINVCASGHSGSLTTVHAGSCELAIDRLCMMAMQADAALPFDVVKRMVESVVDVVVHISTNPYRHISGVMYQGELNA